MKSIKPINQITTFFLLTFLCGLSYAQNITYDYVGCYAYMPGLSSSSSFCQTPFTPAYTMSNKICSQFCAFYSFAYSATYNGGSCCCYNDMSSIDTDYEENGFGTYMAVKDDYCTTPCFRNTNEACGGQDFYEINIFGSMSSSNSSSNSSNSSVSSNYGESFGCKLINSTTYNTALSSALCSPYNNTIDSCMECCESLNMTFAVVIQYNCYCSETNYFDGVKVPSTETCGLNCLGNDTQYCGGESFVGAFNRINYITNDTEYYVQWQGGYKVKYSSRNPNLFIEVPSDVTKMFSMVELMRICSLYGFSYGYQSNPYYDLARLVVCFSYMNQTTSVVDSARSNHPVDLSYINFAQNIAEVYQLYEVPKSFKLNLKRRFVFKYVGCYINSFADAVYTPVGNLTNNLCSQFCASINYTYSGTKQRNCFCGSQLIGTQVNDSQCNYACPNGIENCGSANSLSVYKNSLFSNSQFYTIVPNIDIQNEAINILSTTFVANRLLCGNLCNKNIFCQSFLYKKDQNCTLLNDIPDPNDYFQSSRTTLHIKFW